MNSNRVQDAATVGQLVRAPKTAELIASHLRRRIVRGELTPGETLPPEVQLMAQFGVSRPTLREAFRILETEGLIHVRRGSRGGAQVTVPDSSVAGRHVGLLLQMRNTSLQDVYEARTVIEPYCARLLAQRRSDGDVAALRDRVSDLTTAVYKGPEKVPDTGRWAGLTDHFHELIFGRCGNKTLAVQCGVLQDIVATHLRQTVARGFSTDSATAKGFRPTIRSYTTLTDLVEARDAAGAEAHWRRHMEVAGAAMFAQLPSPTSVIELFG